MRAAALLVAGLAWLIFTGSALAHGLLVDTRSEGTAVAGTVRYSNGEPGAGEWVQMFDLTAPGTAPASTAADAAGRFRLPGIVGHHYRILVAGGEGHAVEHRIVLGVQGSGETVDTGASHDR